MLKDVMTALQSMGKVASEFLIGFGKHVLFVVVLILCMATLGYFFFHYFYQSLTVTIMAMLCTWFWMELKTARFIREKEEQQEAYWAEKSKPMHTEYKETL